MFMLLKQVSTSPSPYLLLPGDKDPGAETIFPSAPPSSCCWLWCSGPEGPALILTVVRPLHRLWFWLMEAEDTVAHLINVSYALRLSPSSLGNPVPKDCFHTWHSLHPGHCTAQPCPLPQHISQIPSLRRWHRLADSHPRCSSHCTLP